jgi:hypothetical protein
MKTGTGAIQPSLPSLLRMPCGLATHVQLAKLTPTGFDSLPASPRGLLLCFTQTEAALSPGHAENRYRVRVVWAMPNSVE